jgi:thiosulfate dehydrogenase
MKTMYLNRSLLIGLVLSVFMVSACTENDTKTDNRHEATVIKKIVNGGKLYDKWWVATIGTDLPEQDHPLWKDQNTNKRHGSSTWRCKECHGWDYLGKDGAYGAGSHKTGFQGILSVKEQPDENVVAILLGSTNPDHDFSAFMDYDSIYDLSVFIQEGVIDYRSYINYESKKPLEADFQNGKAIYEKVCAVKCHGAEGKAQNFATEEDPEYIGTVANDNPWEFVHKVRFSHPKKIMPALRIKLKLEDNIKDMPSGIEEGYTIDDIMDLLEYSQSLPK